MPLFCGGEKDDFPPPNAGFSDREGGVAAFALYETSADADDDELALAAHGLLHRMRSVPNTTMEAMLAAVTTSADLSVLSKALAHAALSESFWPDDLVVHGRLQDMIHSREAKLQSA